MCVCVCAFLRTQPPPPLHVYRPQSTFKGLGLVVYSEALTAGLHTPPYGLCIPHIMSGIWRRDRMYELASPLLPHKGEDTWFEPCHPPQRARNTIVFLLDIHLARCKQQVQSTQNLGHVRFLGKPPKEIERKRRKCPISVRDQK